MFLALPWPPSENRYRRVVGFIPIISKEGRLYKEQVKTMIRARDIPRISGPVMVRITLAPPDNRRRDLDNTLKAIFDAISDDVVKRKNKDDQIIPGIIDDDANIVKLNMAWSKKTPGGKVLLEIVSCEDKRDDFSEIVESICENGYYIYK